MYKLNCAGNIQYTEKVWYVYRQKANGVIVTCGTDLAEGFLGDDNSTIYAFEESPLDGEYETGTVEELTLEEFVEDKNSYIEEALCDLDIQDDERMSAIEDALCDLDATINGG